MADLVDDFPRCNHPKSEVRRMKCSNGTNQYKQQCLHCGSPTSAALSMEKAVRLIDGPIRDWDKELHERWGAKCREATERRWKKFQDERANKDAEWWAHYSAYLKTPKWAAIRRAVIDRDQGLCQGCRKARATDAHHLSYAHVGDEFLFELISVCFACHQRLHPDKELRADAF